MSRPLCTWCAKPMPKRTGLIYFGQEKDGTTQTGATGFKARPATKAEAQAFTNHEIVSSSTWLFEGKLYIHRLATWDGESYASGYGKLCSGQCAKLMGMAAAENGMTSKTYAAKMKETTSV